MAGRSPFDRNNEGFQSIRDEEAEFAPPKKKKTTACCCCLPLWATFLIILIIISGTAVTLFFLWPRIPSIQYLSSSFGKDGNDNQFLESNKVLSSHFKANMQLKNPNYLPLNLRNVTIEISIPVDGGNSVKIGQGYLLESIIFPSKSTTEFVIDSDITLDLKSDSSDNIKAIDTIVKSCKSETNKKLNLNYFAKTDVPLVSWTGYQPSFSGVFEMDCPFKT
ncbi:hypothetical protein K502DRAFT_313930 [Neoconidiobolus thromboides FSU 785]|nr:hypothetical protein K502DRAFT_313930 [Neoconidiobolus thromboides FSU 785]